MVHKEFLLLSEEEQYDLVLSRGVKVAEHVDGPYRYILYQVDSFYIEGKMDIENEEVKSIVSFSATAPLDRYTGKIDLPF